MSARIPLDVDLEDKLLYGLTPTKLAYLAIALLAAFSIWSTHWAPVPVRAGCAVAVAGLGVSAAWGRWRDRALHHDLAGDRRKTCRTRHCRADRDGHQQHHSRAHQQRRLWTRACVQLPARWRLQSQLVRGSIAGHRAGAGMAFQVASARPH